MKKVLFIFLFYCFICSSALAEWKEISDNHYISSEKPLVRKNLVRTWFLVYKPAITTVNGIDAFSWVHLVEADCNYGKIRGFASVYYDEDNNILDSYNFENGTNWTYPHPDSVGEFEYKTLCKYRQ